MIELTEPLQQALASQPDRPLKILDPRTQQLYVLVRADIYEQLSALWNDEPDMAQVAALVERNMHEYDIDDPHLASYQEDVEDS